MKEKVKFGNDNTIVHVETAVLVAVVPKEQSDEQTKEYLDELEFLAETDGVKTLKRFTQRLPHPDNKSYIGKGKLEEIKAYVEDKNIDLVIIDDEISPSQQRNIEEVVKKRVLDRSMLILDIFAQRARTVQAKTQVELAQLQYMLPRLKGMWTHLERQRGGTGTRGGNFNFLFFYRVDKLHLAGMQVYAAVTISATCTIVLSFPNFTFSFISSIGAQNRKSLVEARETASQEPSAESPVPRSAAAFREGAVGTLRRVKDKLTSQKPSKPFHPEPMR